MGRLLIAVAMFGFMGCGVGDESQTAQSSISDNTEVSQSSEALNGLSGNYRCQVVAGKETGKCISLRTTCVPPFTDSFFCAVGKVATQLGTKCTYAYDITMCGN